MTCQGHASHYPDRRITAPATARVRGSAYGVAAPRRGRRPARARGSGRARAGGPGCRRPRGPRTGPPGAPARGIRDPCRGARAGARPRARAPRGTPRPRPPRSAPAGAGAFELRRTTAPQGRRLRPRDKSPSQRISETKHHTSQDTHDGTTPLENVTGHSRRYHATRELPPLPRTHTSSVSTSRLTNRSPHLGRGQAALPGRRPGSALTCP